MSEEVYQEFADALRSDDRQRAFDVADQFIETLSEETDIDVGRETTANQLLGDTVLSEQTTELAMNVLSAAKEARQLRAEIGSSIQSLGSEKIKSDVVADKVERLSVVRSELKESYRQLQNSAEMSELEPILVSSGPSTIEVQAEGEDSERQGNANSNGNGNGNGGAGNSGQGGSNDGNGQSSSQPQEGEVLDTTATVEFRNVGGEDIEDLSVTVNSSLSNYSATPEEIESIPAGGSSDLSVQVARSNEPGQYRLDLEFSSGVVGTTESISVAVVNKQRYVQNAVTSLDGLEDRFEQLESKSSRSLRSFKKTIQRAERDLSEVQSQLAEGSISGKKANRRIFSSRQQIASLTRKLGSLKFLSEGRRASLRSKIQGVIGTLDRALEAGT